MISLTVWVNDKARRVASLFVTSTCVFSLASVLGCSNNNTTDDVVVTSIDDVIPTAPASCQAGFNALAQDLIGVKTAFLAKNALPASVQAQTNPTIATYTGTLVYNDRPSHLLVQTVANGANCSIRYQLDYQLDIPCVEAREEAFRKWQPAGAMGELTKLYRHQHYPYKTAYLTHITNDTQCMIRVQVDVPDENDDDGSSEDAKKVQKTPSEE